MNALISFCFTGLQSFGKVNVIDRYWSFFLPLIPAAGGLLVGLYHAFVVKAGPEHGHASVIKAVEQNGGVIEKTLWFHKSLTSVLSIGTGGEDGREAPTVQVGAATGSAVAQLLRFSASRTRRSLDADLQQDLPQCLVLQSAG
jgi:CIC family chloride channel protein